MNAYKLADQVEMWGEDLLALNMKGGIPVVQGAKMLRKQADRIAELEEENALLRKRFGEELDGHHSALHRLAKLKREMMRQKGMESND